VTLRAHAPLDEALACSDVLLLPSRYEGLPLVALEAAGRGWPVVATHEAGLGTLLPDAARFAFGDADGLVRALKSLHSDAARRQAVQHTAQALAAQDRPARYRAALRGIVQGLTGADAAGRAC
jgi:glycosyltransferase involved in cell wall biosynthesis